MRWADDWQRHHPDREVVVQHGHSDAPLVARAVPFLEPLELAALVAQSDVVIGHGGPGTLMTARANGRLPILVPRDPELGEHVDGHQMRFALWVSSKKLAMVVTEVDALGPTVETMLKRPIPVSAHVQPAEAAAQVLARLIDDLRSGPRTRRRRTWLSTQS